MADDVLVGKLFNYICGSGGFVEIAALLKHSSPLRSRKSELEARNWLKTQAGRRFVVVKDCNDEIAGVRVNLRKKICRQYHDKGFCRRARRKCKGWHICKGFVEEKCDGKCGRSHNFFDGENLEKTRELGLDKHPNRTVKNIVVWSLPQVCQLYMRGECVSDKCFYLHVCDEAVRGLKCYCSLSHSLTDSRNNKILKQYDLIPHQSMTIEFVRFNVIVPLSFIPPASDMSQTNVKYGTTVKEVRTRPASVVSKGDICQLKRSHNALPANKQQGENSREPNVPSHWSPMPSATEYQRIPLAPYSHEFEDVKKLFRKTIERGVVIVSIERVQNPFMWEKYQRKKENMSAAKSGSTKGTSVNEKQLFHGTNPTVVEAICKHNFDWRLRGKNATVYGEGSYFALNSSYSDNYAKEDLNGSKFMFVAKVLVGSYTTGHYSYRRPPSKNPSDPASDLYDSCVDDISFPTIFVVFDADQFYPEYIVEYTTVSQTVQGGIQRPAARALAPKPRHVQAAAAPPRAFQSQRSTSTTRHHTPTSSSVLGTSAYSSGSSGTGAYSAASSAPHYGTITPYTGTSIASYSSAVSGAFPGVSSRYASSTSSTLTSLPYHNNTSSSTYNAYTGWSNDDSDSDSSTESTSIYPAYTGWSNDYSASESSTKSTSTAGKIAAVAAAGAAVAAVAAVVVAAATAPSRNSSPPRRKTSKKSSKDEDSCLVM